MILTSTLHTSVSVFEGMIILVAAAGVFLICFAITKEEKSKKAAIKKEGSDKESGLDRVNRLNRQKKDQELARNLKKIAVVVLGIAFVLGIYNLSVGRSDKSDISAKQDQTTKNDDKDDYGHDKYDADVVAEKIVKDNLKSPSTAKFCDTRDKTIKLDGNTWTVKGWVDAQNSFGATVRTEFTVEFTFTGSQKYTINSCNIR